MVSVVQQMRGLPQFQQHLLTESPTEMTSEEWKTLAKFVPIQKPTRGTSILRSHHCPFPQLNSRQSACGVSDLSALGGNFSKEEQANLLQKAKTVLNPDQFRQGFKDSLFFVDSASRKENVHVIAISLAEITFVTIV